MSLPIPLNRLTSQTLKYSSLFFFGFLSIFFIFQPLIIKPSLSVQPQVKAATALLLSPPVPQLISSNIASTSAQAITIFDPQSQTFIYQQNSHVKRHPASLTKLMTALVALDHYPLDQVLTVKSANNSIGHNIRLIQGDQLVFKDLLRALLIASGNGAALTLAENYPGGYTSFITAMNQKARQLNLNQTNFTNVSGLDGSNHLSTAYDLTLLASQVINHPLLRQIVSTQFATITNVNNTHHYYLYSTNELLGRNGVIGIKTGWTENAGENLITLTQKDGHELIITVLGSQNRFADSQILINWAFENILWE